MYVHCAAMIVAKDSLVSLPFLFASEFRYTLIMRPNTLEFSCITKFGEVALHHQYLDLIEYKESAIVDVFSAESMQIYFKHFVFFLIILLILCGESFVISIAPNTGCIINLNA